MIFICTSRMSSLETILNPPLNPETRWPLPVPGEMFILHRDGLQCDVKIPTVGKFRGRGILMISSIRITFICEDPSVQNGVVFDALDIPILYISASKFDQPIFGANNIQVFYILYIRYIYFMVRER